MDIAHNLLHLTDFLIVMRDRIVTRQTRCRASMKIAINRCFYKTTGPARSCDFKPTFWEFVLPHCFASPFEFFRRHLQGVPARHERGEGNGKFQKRVKHVGHAALQHGSTGPVL